MILSSLTLLILPATACPQEAGPELAWGAHRLTSEFFGEGATFGDFNRDGAPDVASGPYWYEGPGFAERHEIYEPKAFDVAGYSDHFFDWSTDIDGDGWLDLFVIGFPGQEAWWFQNPGDTPEGEEHVHWRRSVVHDAVDNESPAFTDIDGDGLEDLVCHSQGLMCWFGRDKADPFARWTRHDFSRNLGLGKFTHGMGVGDLSGDGRPDVLLNFGWFEQPESLEGDPEWTFHKQTFSPDYGGAQMLVTDVDGDGDQDVIGSLRAHSYGLSWFESIAEDGARTFVEHPIMGSKEGEHDCPMAVSELHALDLVDVNGDGLLDVVTGKRYLSHGRREPGSSDPPYLMWFELRRSEGDAVAFLPHLIDDASGVGTQIVAGDIDGDGRTDVVVGNKTGTSVHLQRDAGSPTARVVTVPAPAAPAPDERFPAGAIAPRGTDGKPLNLDFERGDLSDWTVEGEAFEGQPILGDTVAERKDMNSAHHGAYWIGGYELHGDNKTGKLTSAPFVLTEPFAAFLIAGGRRRQLHVDVVTQEDGVTIGTSTGYDHETLRPTVLDLTGHVGKVVFLRIVDDLTGHWGHINFDHFRLYAERPEFAPGLELSSVPDEIENAGLTPQEAVRAMTLPGGFQVDVLAAEPDLHQPIAFTFDERGRIWVLEAYAYPFKREEGEGEDKVIIFEDADGNGSYEKRTLFADGLNLVSGIEVGFGGVFIGAAPELLFIPDANGDDVPDGPPEVLLDGWGYEDTHETLNAFTWGPDGWLYGCHGVFTYSDVGKPGTPDHARVPINAGVWRYHPTRRDFEVFAWGTSNPWGLDFDDHGRAFVTACVIPHLFHLVPGGRYQRQAGDHFNDHIYADIGTAADHLHYLGDLPHDGNGVSSDVGGGHAHCGAMIYLGGDWPDEYRNNLFVNNVHGNRVNREILEKDRSGYVGKHGQDLLLANDFWFRGINMRYGPDGSVVLIDWYDEQACHYPSDEIWNRTNGRMYRISYGDLDPVHVDLGALNESELIQLQLNGNDWYVRTARRLLQERGLSGAGVAQLRLILDGNEDLTRRLRALWTLHAAGATRGESGTDLLLEQLKSQEPELRAWAIQLACEDRAPLPRFLLEMQRLAPEESSPVVRLHMACALQRLPLPYRWNLADSLVQHAVDAGDQNVPFLLWYGIEPLVAKDPARAMGLAARSKLPVIKDWIIRRAAHEEDGRETIVALLARTSDDAERRQILGAMMDAIGQRSRLDMPRGWSDAYPSLAKSEDDRVRDTSLVLAAMFGDPAAFPALRAALADPNAPLERRLLAVASLRAGKDVPSLPLLCDALADEDLRSAALKALSVFDDARVPAAILERFESFDEGERRDAIATLTSRADSALALLDGVENGIVDRAAITAYSLRKMSAMESDALSARIEEVWGTVKPDESNVMEQIAAWKERLTEERLASADLAHGREVFSRTCQRCHSLYGEGLDIGPDITGANRSDLDYLLHNMVAPNAIIPKEYQMTVVLTNDGQLLNGIALEEDDETLTLRGENEDVFIEKADIQARRIDPNSLMPMGQLETLAEDEAVALVAYLQSERQVPMRLTESGLDHVFDGETLAGWIGDEDLWSVREGAIVGTTPGIASNEFLISDFEVGDFRLIVDVKLDPDGGNSGIQFRSHLNEESGVAGYQADMGVGWWGSLYDEHGRAMLVQAEDVPVETGDWNTYEILAVGDRIQTAINGHLCVDFTDPEPTYRGILAFQIHSSANPFEVSFKDLRIELDPEPILKTVE
ncbi:FG-GAP repeat protein [Planctomycetes bacterium Poly30]|uniref:FG-GAP repeat protein n=1 Tax=Saltatorellus ferox TaxID=2528018 RepID=A0A518EQ30_9BACT|nr:FG-GAP repeat protein [Planctomycetes bacterium Poly30]